MDRKPGAAGLAALAICESLLLSLTENKMLAAGEARAILEDAAAFHLSAAQGLVGLIADGDHVAGIQPISGVGEAGGDGEISQQEQRGKGQQFWTVLSDVVHGEVIGLQKDRSEMCATALLTETLTARQRAAITAVCTDMHRPYLNAVGEVLKQAEVVFDKFHVLQHASAALDQ